MIQKFRKKPVVIEAIQFTGDNQKEIYDFIGGEMVGGLGDCLSIIIHTLEGDITAQTNDWIIKGINGEFYPCKPDIFKKTYEKVLTEKTGNEGIEEIKKSLDED